MEKEEEIIKGKEGEYWFVKTITYMSPDSLKEIMSNQ